MVVTTRRLVAAGSSAVAFLKYGSSVEKPTMKLEKKKPRVPPIKSGVVPRISPRFLSFKILPGDG